MATKRDEELWAALVAAAQDRADAELSDETIDAELRAAGLDPNAVAHRGATAAARAQAGNEALAPPTNIARDHGRAKPSHRASAPLHSGSIEVEAPPPLPIPVKPKKD
jgi:hypothetical protein